MKKEGGLFILGVVAGVVGTCLAIKHKEEIKGKVSKLEKKIRDMKDKVDDVSSDKVMKVVQKIAEKVYREKTNTADKKEEEVEVPKA
jgi:uncharacterized membrane protein YgaE (UPF0421/DUF939 family)